MSTTKTLIEDFRRFFIHFQETWNSCNANNMTALLSEDLTVRWGGPETTISDWGYEEACEGWKEAYKQYEGHYPKWYFQELHITPASENEVIATFWVTFEMDGTLKEVVKLFVQRFRKEQNNEWKLIREYCESLSPEHFISN
ncbi:YybH family protein [Bacillus ndiopicus]|uniref:YybH family protein n=1 Tax=Bacillus ndiopicus TaxID=1347368 RepID=UPI0005A93E57|nr:nuclear transport factor 2 family protein [Bacillus ndiopicus]